VSDPELTPDQDEQVRRLLADARHDEPMPAAVVERMDRALGELSAEPALESPHESAPEAPVIPLHTRRRRATGLLVAAAAVIAVGIGISQVVDQDAADDGATTTADRNVSRADEKAPEEAEPEAGADSGGQAAESAPQAVTDLPLLRPARLEEDVRAARPRDTELDTTAGQLSASKRSADAAAGAVCGSDAWGKGTFVPVRYGETPAVLVFRRPQGDTQAAELFLCGRAQPVRTVTLPAP
jgi:hypothetical protein